MLAGIRSVCVWAVLTCFGVVPCLPGLMGLGSDYFSVLYMADFDLVLDWALGSRVWCKSPGSGATLCEFKSLLITVCAWIDVSTSLGLNSLICKMELRVSDSLVEGLGAMIYSVS